MITVRQLRQQGWIKNNDKFNHINAKEPRLIKLIAHYEHHPYAGKFIKEHNLTLRKLQIRYGIYLNS